ncbi:hypothetical protein ACFLR2_00185 [Chlamydiota bacterium]
MREFDWQRQPEAEKWLYSLLEEFKAKNPSIAYLEEELRRKTSSRLFDWIDHFTVQASASVERELERGGFTQQSVMPSYRVFAHPGAQLPSVLVREEISKHPLGVAVKVESIADFLMVHKLERVIEGSLFAPYRRCLIEKAQEVALLCVERRSSRTMEPVYQPESALDEYLSSLERLQSRSRHDLPHTLALIEEIVAGIGKEAAAWAVLEVERKYWQARNLAGQLQKNRQDSVGMGWANHDHHTFRSSRKNFASLVRLFETLGFTCRERFYAGAQSGWGAQVMENATCGLVLFLDVDLAPEELEIDFAHHPLSERNTLGTVGLWCALHGDSILESGMHHLEAQFMFEKLKEDLAAHNVDMMEPFSKFPYLKQAFTKGELWPVDPSRVNALSQAGLITPTQAEHFLTHGAIGSHLENLQRDEGYKGFNKDNVSLIIRATDPRTV